MAKVTPETKKNGRHRVIQNTHALRTYIRRKITEALPTTKEVVDRAVCGIFFIYSQNVLTS